MKPWPPERRMAYMAGIVVAGFVVMQLVGPDLPEARRVGDHGLVTDHMAVPSEIQATFRRACYDCHSNETHWPWYARVAPVSWLIVRDVRRGRVHLNFSDWWTDPQREPTQRQRLRFMCQDVRGDSMPPSSYVLMHPRARLTDGEAERICTWTERALDALSSR
jgi:hypothetical protein